MGESPAWVDVLSPGGVHPGRTATDRTDAVRQCGEALVALGAVEPAYVESMLEREATISTYVGEGIAIPHGTGTSRALVRRTALAVLTFPDGVAWDSGTVYACVAIAASGSEHVSLLAALAEVLLDPARASRLRTAASAEDVIALLTPEESTA